MPNCKNFRTASVSEFQAVRQARFRVIKQKLLQIDALCEAAETKTMSYYSENPKSWAVVYPTDAIEEDLDLIIEQLRGF